MRASPRSARKLVAENSYAPGEPDRVVLFVSLRAERDGEPVFHETWSMDAAGNEHGSAMARLVSIPVSIAIESVVRGEVAPGVHAAPSDPTLVTSWLDQIRPLADYMERLS